MSNDIKPRYLSSPSYRKTNAYKWALGSALLLIWAATFVLGALVN